MIRLGLKFDPKSNTKKAIARLEQGLSDLKPLAREISTIVKEGNARAAEEGIGANSKKYRGLSPYTRKHRTHMDKPTKLNGPPLAPAGKQSRIVKNFRVQTRVVDGEIRVVGYWIGMPFLKYHVTGYKHHWSGKRVPKRNPAGIRERDMLKIKQAVNRHFQDKAKTTYSMTTYGV